MSRYRYSDQQLADAVRDSMSVMEVMRRLGIKLAGGSHYHLSRRIERAGIDTSHFRRQGWNKGQVAPTRLTPEQIFRCLPEGSPRPKGYQLRRALLESGVPYACDICGTCEWQGNPLALDVDHIDGDWLNNTRENLRFLCPNCHSQTDTFGNRTRPSSPTR